MSKRAVLAAQAQSGRVLAVMAMAGLLGACGGTGKLATHNSATSTTAPGVAAGAANSAPATSTTVAGSASATNGSGGTVGSAAAGRTTSTTNTSTRGAPADPPTDTGAAPMAGSYQYKSTDDKGTVTQLRLDIKTSKSSGSVTDQSLTISSPQGSEKNDYSWDPSKGVMVSSTTLSGEQGSVTCNWNPDIVQYVLPIHNGATWTSLSNCSTTVAKAPATATYSNKAMVAGSQQIQIAGQSLATWVINRTTVLTLKSAAFDLKITTVSTEYFAPADGETPRELTDTTTSGSYGGRNFSQETKATIEAETLKPS